MSEYVEIRTKIDDMFGGFWKEYKGNSIGRAIQYLYHICGLKIAEESIFGNGEVRCWGKFLAKIDWNGGYPFFTFEDEEYNERQKKLLAGQRVGRRY